MIELLTQILIRILNRRPVVTITATPIIFNLYSVPAMPQAMKERIIKEYGLNETLKRSVYKEETG